MILTWKKNISKKQARAELDDSFALLSMVVDKSQHMARLTLLYFTHLKKKHFYDYMYIFSLTVNV